MFIKKIKEIYNPNIEEKRSSFSVFTWFIILLILLCLLILFILVYRKYRRMQIKKKQREIKELKEKVDKLNAPHNSEEEGSDLDDFLTKDLETFMKEVRRDIAETTKEIELTEINSNRLKAE